MRQRLTVDDIETREGTGRDARMREIAAQLDAEGIEYEMPIPPSKNPRQYGLSGSEMLRKKADILWMLPIMRRALASGDVSKVAEYLDELLEIFWRQP